MYVVVSRHIIFTEEEFEELKSKFQEIKRDTMKQGQRLEQLLVDSTE
jgi:hypothetical protein